MPPFADFLIGRARPQDIYLRRNRLQMPRIYAATVQTSWAAKAGLIGQVAQMINLKPIQDWAFVQFVTNAVRAYWRNTSGHTELAVSVFGVNVPDPIPAAFGYVDVSPESFGEGFLCHARVC